MLFKLRIRNFKSIRDSRDIKLKPLTIFVGPNSSGKSSILESIWFLSLATKKSESNFFGILSEYFSKLYNTHKYPVELISFRRDKNNWISFELYLKPKEETKRLLLGIFPKIGSIQTIGYGFSYLPKEDNYRHWLCINEEVIADVTYDVRKSVNGVTKIPKILKPDGFSNFTPKGTLSRILNRDAFYFEPRSHKPITTEQRELAEKIKNIAHIIIDEITQILSNTYLLTAIRGAIALETTEAKPEWVGMKGEDLLRLLALCFSRREYTHKAEKIEKWAKRFGISKLKAGWTGEREKLGADFEDPKLKVPIELALAGHGSRQALVIITQLIWSEPGSVILIEEPEISLHPEQQLAMMELFIEAINEGKQIICTTHSPIFILSLGYVVGEGILDSPEEKVAIYHVEKKENGTEIKLLKLNEYGFIMGWIPGYLEVERKLFSRWVDSLEAKKP